MKIKKSNLTIYILTSAAFISLIGVGFSSWVLDKIQGDSQQINAEIGKITDNSLIASIDKGSSKLDPICFDANDANGEIVANGDSKVSENMDFVVAFNIEAGYALNGGDIEIKFTFDDIAKEYSTYLDASPESQYIQYIDTSCLKEFAFTMPTATNTTIDNTPKTISSVVTYSNEYKSAKVVSTFTFKWGSAFEYKNPCESKNISVIETLKAFNYAFSQIGSDTDKAFTVTITPSKKVSSL